MFPKYIASFALTNCSPFLKVCCSSVFMLEQFRENKKDPHKKNLWKAVKNLKGKFSPKFIQMRNKNGMLVPLRKRAEAIADYLEQKHWKNEPEGGKKRTTKKGLLRNWSAKAEEQSKARQTRPFKVDELKESH